jgi:hypothetical protein
MTSPQELNGRDGRHVEARERVPGARASEESPGNAGAHAANVASEPQGAQVQDADRTDADVPDGAVVSGDHERPGGSRIAMVADRRSVVDREKKRYGGIKWGSAFFGSLGDSAGQAATIGLGGAIALLVVLLIAYFCGGYVAGRMARFNGVKQGVAVWIWAIVIAVVVAVAGKVLGDKYDVLAKLGGFPRLPFSHGDVTTAAVVALVIAVVAALVGAVLGGLAGMRFHRKVDRAGLGA